MSTSLRKVFLLVLWMAGLQNYLSAQDKFDIKFGKVSPADFDLSAYKFDTAAGAVFVADMGTTVFEGKGLDLGLVFKRQVRIKILNKTGFDAASFEIPLFVGANNAEEKLERLQAVTYNLENGKVEQVKLESRSVFTDKLSKAWIVKKFTLPAVKEGSIIEVSYTIKSMFIENLQPWEFQGAYPRIWSEYTTKIPGFYGYVVIGQGYHPFHIRTQDVGLASYVLIEDMGASGTNTHNVSSGVLINRWAMKDVPALKEESFVTTPDNHISKVRFQFVETREPLRAKSYMSNWTEFSTTLMKRETFGGVLESYNDWLDNDMKTITAGATSSLEKARKIYNYVQKNFTCTGSYGYSAPNSLKSVFKSKSGNAGELNMMLIAMLRHQGIQTDPVLLSTRDHGVIHPVYPIEDQFNYVVAKAQINDQSVLMDASERRLGFGRLPIRCYNGQARVINPQASVPLFLKADSLKESKLTSVFFSNGDGGKMIGTFASKLGYYESLNIREKLAGKGKDELLKSFKTHYSDDYELSELEIDSVDNYDQPVEVRYNIDTDAFKEDIIYFNPMLAEGYKDNYFKAADRKYPVEMPYAMDEMYICTIEIPNGYTVDEIPQSLKVTLNETDGMFEYLISKSTTTINLRSRVKLNRANFQQGDYEGLRNFFSQVVKKHNEQIVFKKKK